MAKDVFGMIWGKPDMPLLISLQSKTVEEPLTV